MQATVLLYYRKLEEHIGKGALRFYAFNSVQIITSYVIITIEPMTSSFAEPYVDIGCAGKLAMHGMEIVELVLNTLGVLTSLAASYVAMRYLSLRNDAKRS